MTQLSSVPSEFADRNRISLQKGEALLAELLESTEVDPNTLLDRLNTLLLELENIRGDATLFSQVHPDLNVRGIAEQFLRSADQLHATLMHSMQIHAALEAVEESSVQPLAWRFARVMRRDMRRAGVELDYQQRQTARILRDDLIPLEQEFARNIRDGVRQIELSPEDLAGLPADYLAAHSPGQDGLVHITTRPPDYYPFMSYAASERARAVLLYEFYNRAVPSNLNVLRQLLETGLAPRVRIAVNGKATSVTCEPSCETVSPVHSNTKARCDQRPVRRMAPRAFRGPVHRIWARVSTGAVIGRVAIGVRTQSLPRLR